VLFLLLRHPGQTQRLYGTITIPADICTMILLAMIFPPAPCVAGGAIRDVGLPPTNVQSGESVPKPFGFLLSFEQLKELVSAVPAFGRGSAAMRRYIYSRSAGRSVA